MQPRCYEATNKVLFKYAPTLLVVKLGKKKKQEPELPATPTQTSWGEGEVGFFQCRLGYKDDSAWFMAEVATLAI